MACVLDDWLGASITEHHFFGLKAQSFLLRKFGILG